MLFWTAVRRLKEERRPVRFRALGSSMAPVIRTLQFVEVAPVKPERLEVGDVVVADVGRRTFLHKVSAIDRAGRRVQIADNRGNVNGWTAYESVYGICAAIGDHRVPDAAAKVAR